MGYFCFICNEITNAVTVISLIRHFGYRHGLTAVQKCKVTCGQLDCMRTFDSVHALRMHLKRHHPVDPYPSEKYPVSSPDHREYETNDGQMECESDDAEFDDECDSDTDNISIGDVHNLCSDFFIVLKSKNVTQSIVDYVCQGFVNIMSSVIKFCSEGLGDNMDSEYGIRLQEVEEICESLAVSSGYKMKKYLRESKGLVEPCEIFLGNRKEIVSSCISDELTRSVKFVPESMQYISIISTIKKLLLDTNCFQSFSTISSTCPGAASSEAIASLCDTDYCKQHPLTKVQKDFLKLHFFYDEFETSNPLGSKANVHKIGGLYMSIHNVPLCMNSQEKYIFPVVYCHSADVKKYGFDTMIRPLLTDLIALENGVEMSISGQIRTVYGAVVMWSGDNLGIHQIFGFSQSFKADKCCHFCYASDEDRQRCFRESDVMMRDRDSHQQDCERVVAGHSDAKESGVHRSCCLAELKYFSIPENICPDAMHDVLEGCLQYELKLIIRQMVVVDQVMSLNDINSRILSFAYGVDSKNKPQPITFDRLHSKEKKLGMNASQAWCFGRYFCLMIGNLVDKQYPYLRVIHMLLDIIDIIFAPEITVSMTYLLEELISKHHELFCDLFPAEHLIPKQHFLVHYPSKMRSLGPCTQYWCMRFESKHASAKDFCRIIHNFRNICKSIAYQQQIKLCVDWIAHSQSTTAEVGPGSALLPCTLAFPEFVFQNAGIALYEEMYFTKYVRVNGSKYMPENVIVMYKDCDMPVFGVIKLIAYKSNNAVFLVEKLLTVKYCSHVHAYLVTYTGEHTAVNQSKLLDWRPLSIQTGYGELRQNHYVVPRYEIIDK